MIGYEAAFIQFLTGMFICLVGILFIIWIVNVIYPRSKQYRNLLTDMYVVGIIRKLAKKDEVNLVEELKEFSKIEKKAHLREKGLSYVIEDELKEKVANVQEKESKKA